MSSLSWRSGRRPTLNQWPHPALLPPVAFAPEWSPTSPPNSASPSNHPGSTPGLLLQPDHYDYSSDLLFAGDFDCLAVDPCDLENLPAFLDGGVGMPAMMGSITAPSVGMNDDFISRQESQHLLDLTFQHQQHSQPRSTAPPNTNIISTTHDSPLFPANSSYFSCFPAQDSPSSNPSSTSSNKRKAASTDADADGDDQVIIKRQRNTVAARKYRQKRLDRIAELEKALEDMTGDRDGLRLSLARKEAEVDALREMLQHKK
ncbi:hypothetical protein G7046_g1187 [Stylonectria norvegica]|nr:hypothetical protein G7046_g1187 [Stylonectria norvegica]